VDGLSLAQESETPKLPMCLLTMKAGFHEDHHLVSLLTFFALVWMVHEANAYLYCELKVGSPKWARKEGSPNSICGVKEKCQTKCAIAKTPQQDEDCLSINCAPLQRRSKRR